MAEYSDRERDFDASLGQVMGSWMTALVTADILRQKAWLAEIQTLFTPDKDGNIPTVDLTTKLDFAGKKADSNIGVQFPVGIALLGEQFAADSAKLSMTMNVEASSLDDTTEKAEASGSGEASYGVGPFKVGIKVSASMSVNSEQKRSSDYRATTEAELNMTRVQSPEPIMRAMDVWSKLVDAQGQIALAQMGVQAQAAAQQSGLLPASGGDSGGGGGGG